MKDLGAILFIFLLVLLILAACQGAGLALGALHSHIERLDMRVVWVVPPVAGGRGL